MARGSPNMRVLPAAVASALFVVAAAAPAAGAAVARHQQVGQFEERLIYTAGPGEANRVEVRETDGLDEVVIEDPGAEIEAGRGCTSTSDHAVVCEDRGSDVFVDLRDRDDSVRALGDAFLFAKGGDGRDVLVGGSQVYGDELDGGRGADTLTGGRGYDRLVGGPEADVIDGGPGIDIVSYRGYTRPVRVNLRAQPSTAGAEGEGDSIDDVDHVEGGEAGDTLTGRRLVGWGGDDVLRGTGANDLISGMDGDDRIEGRRGGDTISGGYGRDLILAGRGDDHVNSLDWRSGPRRDERDAVRCGPGSDDVTAADLAFPVRPVRDVFAIACERIDVPSSGLRSIKQSAGPALRELTLRIPCRKARDCHVEVSARSGGRSVGHGHTAPRAGTTGIARIALDESVRERIAAHGEVRVKLSLAARYSGTDGRETTGWTVLLRRG